jgi:hypothetical protein
MHLARCPFGSQRKITHDAINDVMYVLTQENEQVVRKGQWYIFTSGISLQVNLYMTHKDQVFVTNVVVGNMTKDIVISNVIIDQHV